MNQLRKLASYVVEGSMKPAAPQSPQAALVPSFKHLDVTYVTSRLMVGGRAIDGPTDKKSCTNNALEMKVYLDAAHAGKYLLFNLCDDNADTAAISPQTVDFSWERDGGIRTYTPPSDHIFRICYAIFAWLALDSDNVAMLYCHNGKTRSGVICACYFLFIHTVDDPMSALAQFYQKRLGIETLTPEYVKRSMPVSIQRFVTHFASTMESQSLPNVEPLLLKAIMFRALPVELQPLIQLWDDDKLVFSSTQDDVTSCARPLIDWDADAGFLAVIWETGISLDGGFSMLCSFGDEYDDDSDVDPTSRVLFRYMNSTWYLSAGLITLKKVDLDMMKQYEHGFEDENFSVDMVFHSGATASTGKTVVPVDYTGNYAVKQGVVEIASHHTVAPDPAIYLNFVKNGFDATASTFALQRAQNEPNLALDILHSEGIATIFTRLLPLAPSPPKPVLVASSDQVTKQSFAVSNTTTITNTTQDETPHEGNTRRLSRRYSSAVDVPVEKPSNASADDQVVVDQPRISRRHSTAVNPPETRRSSIETKPAAESTNFQDAVCAICREEDYVLRPQLVRCVGPCQGYFHTGCAELKKIPFGLTTLSDRANHSSYLKKYFGAWECSTCKAAGSSSVDAGGALPTTTGSQSSKSPTKQKLEQLRLLLVEKGLSLDDLLKVADAKEAPPLETYQEMINKGVPLAAAQNRMIRDGADPSLLVGYVPRQTVVVEETKPQVLLLRDAIQFEGYFAMLSKGCSKDAVKHKMKMCGLNPAILDLDPKAVYTEVRDKIEELQTQYSQPRSPPKDPTSKAIEESPSTKDASSEDTKSVDEPEKAPTPDAENKAIDKEVTLKDDPVYAKYFKMLKMNIPEGAVRQKMIEHGVNLKALELGPDGLVSDLTDASKVPEKMTLKDDATYGKYFKMLRMNIPEGAVRQKMIEHGVNVKALELGPDGLVSDLTSGDDSAKATLLKDDPVYGKYFKMLKMNIPEGAVRQKMIEHGVNVKALELGPDGLVSDLNSPNAAATSTAMLKDDPVYAKYFKMLKMNIPEGAVRQKMIEHGVNPKALELGPDGLVSDLAAAETKALLKDDPVYGKYFKMLKMNIPEGAVRQKMIEHGVNPKALELGPDGLVSDLAETKVMLKDDPTYGKYFKMLKMNIPEGAVRQKMIEHGVNPKALELGPDGFVSQLNPGQASPPKPVPVKRIVRRKKLFWQPIPEDRLQRAESTIWEDKSDNIQLDMDEIETLFFKDTSAAAKKPAAKPLARKQAVTLVDGKRAMNAAIALARIKLSYEEVASAIYSYDAKGLTLEQLTTINEFLPTDEEVGVVQRYTGDPAVLGEAEKFFLAISKVPRFAIKMDCLISKQAFMSHVVEISNSVDNVANACEDVKASRLLKLLLGTVLKLGNTLNGGEETEHAIRGFSVDSLLRLGHTKTNDQKTTVLHYLVRVVRKNQPQVLEFQSELTHVPSAAREAIETIDQMYTALENEVKKTKDECHRMETDESDRPVVDAFQAAIAAADQNLAQLSLGIAEMKHQIATVLEYFGEDPTKKPSDFFQTLSSFCLAFEKAKTEVEAADEARMRAERNTSMRPRATTDAVLLEPAEKAKLMVKNSFRLPLKSTPSPNQSLASPNQPNGEPATAGELDRTASSRF
ncbi:Aste57867_4360 [Aphanomyces stellatus]|uniref:Aste57867_4360 protein n=1 Tax=Aphanomyces stellatus TaxID=120398 RepID=A0A485KBM7_9STRA|nr:hypothetical protein As57867_004348 [Aphanomyces stellatus]VFT81474.1 Aste57867_4360 [Aphanomyces stellatus]